MRHNFGIVLTFLLILGVLIVISSATYVSPEEPQDSELAPNRSSYHSGSTGALALYDFLSESGYKVMRWRDRPEKLLGDKAPKVRTFVIIGATPLSIDEKQAESLLLWVERGGRLVVIDRRPDVRILPPAGDWAVTTEFGAPPPLNIDPTKPEELIDNMKPVHPVQPTVLTQNIESVMPSRFATTITFNRKDANAEAKTAPPLPTSEDSDEDESGSPETQAPVIALNRSLAPVVHLGDSKAALLLDYPHGQGHIILLSDPFMLSNGGISLRDNLQLAINMLANSGELIAFDEYHQGRGATRNALVSYFSGTPVLPILAQVVVLIVLVLWTRSRRFARPLPLAQIDRRSSLEFVASMAELQQRARAFDLAIENIYQRTRRALSRYAGTDYNTPRSEIASRVAARSSLDSHSLEILMRQCEETINGAHVTEKQTLQLVRRLREVERVLGLRMRSRDAKQAAQKI